MKQPPSGFAANQKLVSLVDSSESFELTRGISEVILQTRGVLERYLTCGMTNHEYIVNMARVKIGGCKSTFR